MAAVIDPQVDFYLGGDWVNVADVRQKPPVTITGGIGDEASSISPGKCNFTLNNPAGDWDPRNPMGQYFGDLGKNTPCRVRVPLLTDTVAQTVSNGWGTTDKSGVVWENASSSGGSVVATDWSRSGTTRIHTLPAMNCTRRSWVSRNTYRDCCVRDTVRFTMTTPTGASVYSYHELRVVDTSNMIRVGFRAATGGQLYIVVTDVIAGTTRTLLADTAIDGMEVDVGRQTFNTVTLVEGPVVRAKIWDAGTPEPKDWQIECTRATVREGKVGIASVTGNGNTNTYPMAWQHTDFSVEARPFTGENTEYQAGVADQSHAAPYVQITASGITQRITQGSEPLKSAMFRYWSSTQRWVRGGSATVNLDAAGNNTFRTTDAAAANVLSLGFFRIVRSSTGVIEVASSESSTTQFAYAVEDQLFRITGSSSSGGNTTFTFTPSILTPAKNGDTIVSYREATSADLPVAYWPCEDGKGATGIASGLVGGLPMSASRATPSYADTDSFAGSAPFLKLNNAELNGVVPDYVDTNQAWTVHLLTHYPEATETASGEALYQVWTDSTTTEVWAVSYSTSGPDLTLDVRAFDVNGAGALFLHSYSMADYRDHPTMIMLSVQHTGPTTVTYDISFIRYESDGNVALVGQVTGVTATGVTNLGKLKRVQVNPGGGYINVAVGHISVMPAFLPYTYVREPPGGYVGEAPVRRLLRSAYEEGIPLTYCQGPFSTLFMGSQQQETLLSNWQDVVAFDLGRLYESRGAYSFEYKARSALYNQEHFLDVDYTQGDVLEIEPADDDQGTRNDVTVKQRNGSSYRAVDETSPMSVLPPGEGGVGRYTDAPEVSVLSPIQLPDLANWRVAVGTVNEARFRAIRFSVAGGNVTLEQMFSAGVGNRYRVRNLQARGIYQSIDQLVNSYTLTLHKYAPTLELNGTPASPYNAAVLDDTATRLGSGATETTEDLDTTETSITIHSTDNVTPFINSTDHASSFPVDIVIGGELMTLTACTSPTGADLAQTMTVTRSVNGVVKTHATGAAVELADLVRIPL